MGPLTPIIGLRLLALAAGLRHTARDRSTWPVFQRLRPQIRNQPSSGFAAVAGFARRGRNALGDRSAENHHGREAAGFSAAWPREESNLRTRIRSVGGVAAACAALQPKSLCPGKKARPSVVAAHRKESFGGQVPAECPR